MGRTGIYACGECVSRCTSFELAVLYSLKQEAPASIGGSTFTEISYLLGEQVKMNIRGYVNLMDNAMPLVENSDWGCLTIDGAVSYLNPDRVVFRPFAPVITTNTVLAWRKYGMSFGVASAFLAYIKQAGLRQE